jgi:hypothetical protein
MILTLKIKWKLYGRLLKQTGETNLVLGVHLTDHNILIQEQHGFKTNLKTDDASYHLTNKILNALNNNSLVGVMYR